MQIYDIDKYHVFAVCYYVRLFLVNEGKGTNKVLLPSSLEDDDVNEGNLVKMILVGFDLFVMP